MTDEERRKEIAFHRARLRELSATPRSDWHRAFERILRDEAQKYGEDVQIKVEQELGIDSPRIDYLILDDMKRLMHDKEIFSILRQHNVVEYKNPNDSLNARVISKIIGYANFYIGLARKDGERPRSEVSISIFREGKNMELFDAMLANGTLEKTATPGIYHVKNLTDLPFQIVIYCTPKIFTVTYAAFLSSLKKGYLALLSTIWTFFLPYSPLTFRSMSQTSGAVMGRDI